MKSLKCIYIICFIAVIFSISNSNELSPNKEAVKYLAFEAQKEYLTANQYLKKGEIDEAKNYYNDSFKKLSFILTDNEYNTLIKDDLSAIFENINKNLNKTPAAAKTNNTAIKDNKTIQTFHKTNEKLPNYTIPIHENDAIVQKYIKRFTTKDKKLFEKSLSKCIYYSPLVEKALKKYNLPIELKYLPIVESFYKVNARSRKGALGIWQLMPQTARNLGLKVNYWVDERLDPYKATYAALKYLKKLHENFSDWHLAIAAYNRGEYGILRDIKFSKATSFKSLQDYKAVPRETNYFVPKFMAFTILAENYKTYGFNPGTSTIDNFETVNLSKAVDLKVAAKCAGISISKIRDLNPSIQLWCTPPKDPDFELRIPQGSKEKFLEQIKTVKNLNPSRGFIKYKVKKGECLSVIARKFHTRVSYIKKDNKISNSNRVRAGKRLIIRPGKKYYVKKG